VRSSSLWARLLGLGNAVVESVVYDEDAAAVVVQVRRRRGSRLECGLCGTPSPQYDHGGGRRRWRALDVGQTRAFVEAEAPRVSCVKHGVTVSAVPWARHNSGHTRSFDDATAWLARYTSRTTVSRFLRVAWRTVGAIVTRVVADADAEAGDRLVGVRRIGIDEISYKRGHKYLTVVVDHDSGNLLWAKQGRDKKTLGEFFTWLGRKRCRQIKLVSADGADWIADMVALRCPKAKICVDPFHVVSWATNALDMVRREVWNEARKSGQPQLAHGLARSRYALWKNPEDLTPNQQIKLSWIAKTNLKLYRAYLLKEQLRQVFAPGGADRIIILDAWLRWAARCRIAAFVDLARRLRRYRDDIANTLAHSLSNARVESVNTKIRLLTRIAYGFKSPDALIALAMLHLGGYDIHLPGRPRLP
jgi:transposase